MRLPIAPSRRRGRHVALAVCLLGLLAAGPRAAGPAAAPFQDLPSSIRALLDNGEYENAEIAADRAVGSSKSDSAEALAGIDLLVEALIANGKGHAPRARELADDAVRRRSARDRDPLLATSLRNLGDVLLAAGDYRGSAGPYALAVALREQAPEDRRLEVAEDLDHLALGLAFAERHADALKAANRALAIKESGLGAGDRRIAQTLQVLALILQRAGKYADVRAPLDRALAIRDAGGSNHPALANLLSLQTEQLWFEGDLLASKASGERALAMAQRTLRAGHPEHAEYFRRLALSAIDLGETAEAHRLRARAVTAAENSLGSDHPVVALQLNDLAGSLIVEGDYTPARAMLERARRIYEWHLGPDYSGVTAAVFNQAIVSAALGDFLEARRAYEYAIATWQRVLGPDHPYAVYAQSALGDLLEQSGHHVEAQRMYARVLGIQEEASPRSVDVAITLSRLANSLMEHGGLRRALTASTRAITIWDALPAKGNRQAGSAFLVHGTIQERLGNLGAARMSLRRALEILQRTDAPPQDISVVQVALAGVHVRTGDASTAIQLALDAEQASRDHLLLTTRYLPERQALALAAKRSKGLDLALALAPQSPVVGHEVFDRVIRSRAMVLDEMARRNHRTAYASGAETAPLYTTLTDLRTRLANLAVRGPGGQPRDRYLALLDEVRREKERAEGALAARSAAFRAELDAPRVGLDALRRALPPDSALLSIVRFEAPGWTAPSAAKAPAVSASAAAPTAHQYVAFVLSAGATEPVIVSLGAAAPIDRAVAHWRSELNAGLARNPGAPGAAEAELRRAGVAIRRQVWDPIAVHLGGAERVFVVPDGSLNLVPFAALPIDQRAYLIERGPTIHYLSAERDLASDPAAKTTGTGLLALGGASFEDRAVAAGSMANRRDTEPAPFRGTGPECDRFSAIRFQGLPGSQKEAAEIVALWDKFAPADGAGARPADVLAGANADERSVKLLSPGRRVLHLATHGYFLGASCSLAPDDTRAVGGVTTAGRASARTTQRREGGQQGAENPLLLSGLVLAGANQRARVGPDDDDGILTAEEVASLNLDGVEWAVLSACDTGLGEIRAGEGVLGLRRAFQVAGARTVVMSLWSVQDRAAMTWMRELYDARLRRNLDTAGAVRDASLSVLAARRTAKQSTHPFFWAGFVASGDWR